MAAQELRWLTYLLTDLGEVPRSPPVLYVDNKAMLALCQEHRQEHRTKHISLRYFLARELQQRGQLRLAYVASQANTADVFTKALQPSAAPGAAAPAAVALGATAPAAAAPAAAAPAAAAPGAAAPAAAAPGPYSSRSWTRYGVRVPETSGAEVGVKIWWVRPSGEVDDHVAVMTALHLLTLPAPPRKSRPAAARALRPDAANVSQPTAASTSRSAALCVAPCCSQCIALCCPAHLTLLQPVRRALLQPERRALLPCASRPTAASVSRSAAPRVTPCCSQRVALCCPTHRALLPCTARALPPCPPRALPCSPRRPAATTAAAAAARATAAGGGGAAESFRSAAGAGGARGATGSAGGAAGAGGATGSAGGAAGAGGAGPTTDRHYLLWPLSRQLQWLGVDSGGHCLSRTTPSLSSFASGFFIFNEPVQVVEALVFYVLHRGGSRSAAALGASEPGAALGASASSATGPSSAEALHTFTLDSGASRCFFHDCTTLTPLAAPVPVSLADPTGGPVVARASTVLPRPAVPSGSLSGLHLSTFSANLVSNAAIQDVWVDTFIPGGQRVAICTCSQPGSSLYTLTTVSAQVAEAGQVVASSQVSTSRQLAASYSCRVLSHQTLLWHHRLGHPSLPRLRGMHSRLLVSGLPRSLPSLPRSPAPPCLPCVEGRQRAAPHSSEFPPTTAPLQTLHMDVWGPVPISGTDQERYFLLVVDDYTRYTTIFSLRRKADVSGVLIPWIRTICRQLCERFRRDLPVLRLHSNRGSEFSSSLLAEFYQDEGIHQPFTLPASPQQNGIAERFIGLIMEVARTSMIHAAPPHFLWPFAVQYAAHQLNPWHRVSEPETYPTLWWTRKVGDASVFRVWGAKASNLSSRTLRCVFLGFPTDAPPWKFYHPRSCRVFSSQDVTSDKSVCYYRLHPHASHPVPLAPLFLVPVPPPVDPLPPHGPSPSGVSHVDPPPLVEPLEISSDSSGPAEGGDPIADDTAATRRSPRLETPPEGEGSGGAATGDAGCWGAAIVGADFVGPASPSGGGAVGDPAGARSCLDYVASLITGSESVCPPSVGGELALGSDILEDRQFELECLAVALPRFASMMLCPEGDPNAIDIPTPRSYAEAIAGEYSSQWQTAMDTEMASWNSTGTYVDGVPPFGANIVDGMCVFGVKRPPGSSRAFKARYVTRGFSQRQGVDFFYTFSPTLKMTTLWVLLHVAAQRDNELHSLDFSTAFLQGSLHEEIWLRRPPGFTGSFPTSTQWSLRRPVYGLRQAPQEWHNTLRTTLAALGFAPSSADPSLFLRTDTTLPPFYVLVYVNDLVFATANTEALALRFGFLFSSPQPTPLSTGHLLSAPSDESVEPSGPYPELVGFLMVLRYLCFTSGMGLVLGGQGSVVLTGHSDASWADDQAIQRSSQGYTFSLGSGSVSWRSTHSSSVLSSGCEAEIYAGAMAAQELRWLTYLLTDLGERPRSPPVLYVDNKAMLALCHEQRLEHRTKHIALRYFLARELEQRRQLRLSYVASRASTADVFTKALGSGDHQRFSTVLGLVPTLPHLLVA
ncbi:unnamed protein product [Closterium sp. NIES-54]